MNPTADLIHKKKIRTFGVEVCFMTAAKRFTAQKNKNYMKENKAISIKNISRH